MFDLSRVPDRPRLMVAGAGRYKGAGIDSAGLEVLHLEDERPDTNDAGNYYSTGLALIRFNPAVAAAAFYWTSQLNPGWADPYFARWYALRATRQRLPDSVQKRVDSLVLTAMIHDPFFDERLTMNEFSHQLRSQFAMARRRVNEQIDKANQQRVEAGQPLLTGVGAIAIPHIWYLAFAERHFDSASHDLAREIKKHPDDLPLYVYRAKAQYYQQQYDSAVATLKAAVHRIELKDTTKLLPVYFSREMFFYASAMAEADAHEDSAARADFQRTVTENLGFYMAHLHLAAQALKQGDTATSVSEARIAAQIRPTDPLAQFFYGFSLLTAGHLTDASQALRAAVAADPYFALPYFYLGLASEAAHDTAGSREGYGGFLAHAARADTLRRTAERALSRLGPVH